MYVNCDILRKYIHFLEGHVSCLGILGVILKSDKLGDLWYLPQLKEYGRTAKRLYLRSANNLIASKRYISPKFLERGGGRVSSPGPWSTPLDECLNTDNFDGKSQNFGILFFHCI